MKTFFRGVILAGLVPLSLLGAASSNESSSSSDNQKKYTITTLDQNDQIETMSVEESLVKRVGYFQNYLKAFENSKLIQQLSDSIDSIDLTTETDHLRFEQISLLFIMLEENKNNDYQVYKDMCASLNKEKLIAFWRSIFFVQAPQALRDACGSLIAEKKYIPDVKEYFASAIKNNTNTVMGELAKLKLQNGNQLPWLVRLDNKKINRIGIGDEQNVAANNVTHLELYNNKLTSIDLAFYVELFPWLRYLNLHNNNISNISSGDLMRLIEGDELILSNNNLQDDQVDAQAFADRRGYTVNLSGNNLSQNKIDEIRRVATTANWFARQRHQWWQSAQNPQPLITNKWVMYGLDVLKSLVLASLHSKLLRDSTPWGKKQVDAWRSSDKSLKLVPHPEHPGSVSLEFSKPSFASDDYLNVMHIFNDYQKWETNAAFAAPPFGVDRLFVGRDALWSLVAMPLFNKEYRNLPMLGNYFVDNYFAYMASLPKALIEKVSDNSTAKRIPLKLLYNVVYAGIIKGYLKFLHSDSPSHRLTSYKDLLILSTLGTAFEEVSRFIGRQINTGFTDFKRLFGKRHTPNTIIFDDQQNDQLQD